MPTPDSYRAILKTLDDWDSFLMQESRLPGPRGNLELAQIVADEGDLDRFSHFLTFDPQTAPTNTPGEFLAFCGVLGLGKLIAQGQLDLLPRLRGFASDPRWRTREAVAMALQRWGQVDLEGLMQEMESWSEGSWLEQRAAAAALCEPSLLAIPSYILRVLEILDAITVSVTQAVDRNGEEFRVLRQALGYCWSVVAVASPEVGKSLMEKWMTSSDPDIRWIMKENLKKKRLTRMDAGWVQTWLVRLSQ
jgi:hypothetical protein